MGPILGHSFGGRIGGNPRQRVLTGRTTVSRSRIRDDRPLPKQKLAASSPVSRSIFPHRALVERRLRPEGLRDAVGPQVEGVKVDRVDPVGREGPRDLCSMFGRVVDRLAEDRRARHQRSVGRSRLERRARPPVRERAVRPPGGLSRRRRPPPGRRSRSGRPRRRMPPERPRPGQQLASLVASAPCARRL
jgi:hypothetical protein